MLGGRLPPVDAVDVCPDRLRVSSSCHAANLSVSAAALSPRAVAGVRHRRTRTGAVGVNADTVCKEKKERFRQSVSQCVSPTPRSPQPPGPSSTISPSRGVRSLSLTVHFYTNVVGTLVRRRLTGSTVVQAQFGVSIHQSSLNVDRCVNRQGKITKNFLRSMSYCESDVGGFFR